MSITFYGGSFSPFAKKVLVFAEAKGLQFTHNPIGPRSEDPGFKAASAIGKIPAMCDDGYNLADSSAICHYLDAQYPAHNLIPTEAKARGRCIFFDELADTVIFSHAAKALFNRFVSPVFMGQPGDEALALEGIAGLTQPFDYLESVLPPSGWLVEDRMTLADISMGSIFAALALVKVPVDAAAHPKLSAYATKLLSNFLFAQYAEAEQALAAKS